MASLSPPKEPPLKELTLLLFYPPMLISPPCILSVVPTYHSALYQNRVIQRDVTRNLTVVARQPHWDPNYTVHAAAQTPHAVHAYAA